MQENLSSVIEKYYNQTEGSSQNFDSFFTYLEKEQP